jgi:hypothetical protein
MTHLTGEPQVARPTTNRRVAADVASPRIEPADDKSAEPVATLGRSSEFLLRLAIVISVALSLSGCGSTLPTTGSRGNGDGLPGGTVDSAVAATLFVGMPESMASESLDGPPLTSKKGADGTCQSYRGLVLGTAPRFGIEASGRIWSVCFRAGRVVTVRTSCPTPWTTGELRRYAELHVSVRRQDCRRAAGSTG